MKKFAATGLLMLILFNLCGYRMVTDWLQTRAEEKLQTVIEANSYDSQRLVELSVITNLPYTNDWLDWERCNGTVEINGFHYQYVERKLEKGKMLYRCLPNNEKQNLVAARDEFFQLVNNFNEQSSDQKSPSKSVIVNNFIGDYDDALAIQYNLNPAQQIAESNPWPLLIISILDRQTLTPHQPPRRPLV